jgi:hypothetical protein
MSDGDTPAPAGIPATPPRLSGASPDSRSTPGATAAAFQERLLPSPGVWAAVVFMAVLLGIVALRMGVSGAAITCVVAFVIQAGLLISTAPRIEVGPDEFVAGAARIPISLLGEAETLDPEQMRLALGPDLDARAFLCIRGWIRPGMRVRLNDPKDPTPYWLVSSRRPAELVIALEAARNRPAG